MCPCKCWWRQYHWVTKIFIQIYNICGTHIPHVLIFKFCKNTWHCRRDHWRFSSNHPCNHHHSIEASQKQCAKWSMECRTSAIWSGCNWLWIACCAICKYTYGWGNFNKQTPGEDTDSAGTTQSSDFKHKLRLFRLFTHTTIRGITPCFGAASTDSGVGRTCLSTKLWRVLEPYNLGLCLDQEIWKKKC